MVVVLYAGVDGADDVDSLVRNDWERLREGRPLVFLLAGVDLEIWSGFSTVAV